MTSIPPNYLHKTKFKNISNTYFKDIWAYYCDDGLGFEYILDKEKDDTKKINGHYLEISNTGDYIYFNKNCNANQKDMFMFEKIRKQVVTWLVDFS